MQVRKLMCMGAATFVGSMLIISLATPAHSRSPLVVEGRIDPETQRVVRYGDLNLTNPDGQKRLIRRVSFAINDLCQINQFPPAYTMPNGRECTTAAWNSANPQISMAFDRARSDSFVAAAAIAIVIPPER